MSLRCHFCLKTSLKRGPSCVSPSRLVLLSCCFLLTINVSTLIQEQIPPPNYVHQAQISRAATISDFCTPSTLSPLLYSSTSTLFCEIHNKLCHILKKLTIFWCKIAFILYPHFQLLCSLDTHWVDIFNGICPYKSNWRHLENFSFHFWIKWA